MNGGSQQLSADVEVWTARPRSVSGLTLSSEERGQLERFHFARDARSYATAHALLRRLLSKWGGGSPSDWRFQLAEFGKPFLAPEHGSDLRFNLSHTRGLVAVAVTRGREVGVDVEGVASHETALELRERVLSPVEEAAFSALDASEQARRFFAIWSLKESYIKARGLGLRLPLREISFGFSGPRPELLETPSAGPDEPGDWQVLRDDVVTDHTHAFGLCVQADDSGDELRIDVQHDVEL